MIHAENVSVLVDRKRLLDGVDAEIRPGRVTALIGPNGAGKSTLISLLSGERRPDGGRVTLDGRPMASWPALALARRRAVLLQSAALDFAFTVEEVVELGRLPFAGTTRQIDDERAIAAACRLAGVDGFRARAYQTLSGGEKQRVQFARALAQLWQHGEAEGAARYLLLDEPTSALDLRHQRIVLDAARRLAGKGVGILAALHDLNLAAACADDVIMLRDGCVVAAGPVAEMMTGTLLGRCFDTPIEILTRADGMPAILA
ncbi:MAG: heme ABC transporter ATP-binding protein [Parvibaculum sp.]|uniref:heme ABC transporter ATP-binding protein n=1 Tax=Parvibaculum sp. TaxID=2024848 RepID=UPI0034A06F0B